MEHVAIKIRFKTPCLGARRASGANEATFDKRDGDVVIFMPTWWREILDYGARAASPSVAVELVRKVSFDPDVEGKVKRFERHYKRRGRPGKCDHEAFLPGEVVGIRAMLPDGLDRDTFARVLRTAGPYRGISPYGKDNLGYGRFEVLEVHAVQAGERDL